METPIKFLLGVGVVMIVSDGKNTQQVYLRLATFEDVAALTNLYQTAWVCNESKAEVWEWLERGGTIILESKSGQLISALRWQDSNHGWQLDRVATLVEYRGQNCGRWLMTHLEALAIKQNIVSLSLTLTSKLEELLPYYKRMGYIVHNEQQNTCHLTKRVGGMWQYQN